MKLVGLLLFVLLKSSESYNPEAFDYILRSIEYEASIESGLFQCIFYDLSRNDSFRNILGDVLQSPKLESTLKFVVTNGSFENKLDELPWHPSMFLIYPGSDVHHLRHKETKRNLAFVAECFNPTTKVMVILDIYNHDLVSEILWFLDLKKFNSLVLFDPVTMVTVLYNTVWQIGTLKPPTPMYLFTRLRRKMTGRNITYLAYARLGKQDLPFYKELRWIQETARYLDTEASEFQHGCYGLGSVNAFNQCMERKKDSFANVDIKLKLVKVLEDIPRSFQLLFSTLVTSTRIAVPRDRPLNAFELMLMPFSWQVWMILLAIFIASEVATQFFPEFFRNDPVLLAVCGFERYDLNQARQSEKFLLLSLIVLMFFMSNAFETKIVSLMIDRPSIQKVKTLEDLANSGIKFSGRIDTNPYFAKQSIIGPMIVNGTHYSIHDKVPGYGLYLLQEQAEVLEFTAFDFERMQPWYVLLGYEFYNGPRIYFISWRNQNREAFRHVQIILTEAGLTDLWVRQWQLEVRPFHHGRRLLIEEKVVLDFEDMKLAWGVLAVGLGISMVILVGELIKKQFGFFWKRFVRTD